MTEMLTLVVPPGAEDAPISHGTREFRPFLEDHLAPDSRRLVRMPPDVAANYLRGNTGFYLLPEQNQMERSLMSDDPEMVRMRHPDGGSCGWGGSAYEPDEHGVVTVPAAAVPDLLPHGFRPVPDEFPGMPLPDFNPFDPAEFGVSAEPESSPQDAKQGRKSKRDA